METLYYPISNYVTKLQESKQDGNVIKIKPDNKSHRIEITGINPRV